jgi:hypothetical protein
MPDDLHAQLQDRDARSARHFSPLAMLHLVWRQVDPHDRICFLIEMLTPNERRALQFGFEEEATDDALTFRLERGQEVLDVARTRRGTVIGRGCRALGDAPAVHAYWVCWQDGAEGWEADADLIAVEESTP